MKLSVVGPIQAEHELARDFNHALTALCIRRATIVAQLKTESQKVQETVKLIFEFKVIDASKEAFLPPEARDVDAIRVVRVWKNKHEWDAISARYGLPAVSIASVTVSCIYYRINGVLVKCGKGHELLASNTRVVSDDEWNLIKHGHVHDRLLRRAA